MKLTNLSKTKEKGKEYNYIIQGLKIVMMNIMNYQMLKEIKWSTSMILLNFCLEKYNSDNWFQKEESTNKKGLKILATNKLLTNQYY